MAALSTVKEPELGRDLVSLNMIKDLTLSGSQVSFTVELTTPACPLKDRIEREAREAVMRVPAKNSMLALSSVCCGRSGSAPHRYASGAVSGCFFDNRAAFAASRSHGMSSMRNAFYTKR